MVVPSSARGVLTMSSLKEIFEFRSVGGQWVGVLRWKGVFTLRSLITLDPEKSITFMGECVGSVSLRLQMLRSVLNSRLGSLVGRTQPATDNLSKVNVGKMRVSFIRQRPVGISSFATELGIDTGVILPPVSTLVVCIGAGSRAMTAGVPCWSDRSRQVLYRTLPAARCFSVSSAAARPVGRSIKSTFTIGLKCIGLLNILPPVSTLVVCIGAGSWAMTAGVPCWSDRSRLVLYRTLAAARCFSVSSAAARPVGRSIKSIFTIWVEMCRFT